MRRVTESGNQPPSDGRAFCVVVADAARAAVLVLNADGEGDANSELVEVSEIDNPLVRARRAKAPAQRARGDGEHHFAAEIADEAAAVWSCYPPCELILVASADMLGALRQAVAERLGGPIDPTAVHELARDLIRLSSTRLHEELAALGLLPSPAGTGGGSGRRSSPRLRSTR